MLLGPNPIQQGQEVIVVARWLGQDKALDSFLGWQIV